MRALTAPSQALLGGAYSLACLVEMRFPGSTTYLATCRDNLEWNGHVYSGGRQGAIDQISDQGGQVVGLQFTLSGVPSDYIAIALGEHIQGSPVFISLALMHPDTEAILDVLPLWTGTLDQMPISESGGSASISVTAEHIGLTFARPKGVLYSDAVQQALYPGDRCLEYLSAQAAHQDIWPSASYDRQ